MTVMQGRDEAEATDEWGIDERGVQKMVLGA